MEDLLKNKLKVGDKVQVLYYGSRTPRVEIGTIVGFTEHTARVITKYSLQCYKNSIKNKAEYDWYNKLYSKWVNKNSEYLIKVPKAKAKKLLKDN